MFRILIVCSMSMAVASAAESPRAAQITSFMEYKRELTEKIKKLPKTISKSEVKSTAELYETEILLENITEESLASYQCENTIRQVRFIANAKANKESDLSPTAQSVLKKIHEICDTQ